MCLLSIVAMMCLFEMLFQLFMPTFLSLVYGSTKEEFEDTKRVIRIRITKENNNTMTKRKKYKRTNNDLQNIHIKLKIRSHEPH